MEPLPHATLPALFEALPPVDEASMARALGEVAARPIRYPLGSGQADELALRAGLRPLMRELLRPGDLAVAQARYARAGLASEVAERRYAITRDGWDHADRPPADDDPDARRALFVGRDRGRLEAAIAADLAKTDEADRELGRLLGYPRCCVDAFVDSSSQRKNPEVLRAALARTLGRAAARLNIADLAVFHFVSWYPCAYDCAWSLRYADAVAGLVARLSPGPDGFASRIDAALARHRLVLADDVQLSIDGERAGGALTLREVSPTARDRHPDASLEPLPARVVARALVALRGARALAIEGSTLVLDGRAWPLPEAPVLLPFGER
jgi:hypothetical protein